MRQGNDVGTQYRSGIYCFSAAQKAAAEASQKTYGKLLANGGYGPITTEILDAPTFYYAENITSSTSPKPRRLLRPRRHRHLLPHRPPPTKRP